VRRLYRALPLWRGRGRENGIGRRVSRAAWPFNRFPFVRADPRFREMVKTITAQADREGHHNAGSMYRAWKGWSFADKKTPSPWLTFLVLRTQRRIETTARGHCKL
jgi:hypothetical protein